MKKMNRILAGILVLSCLFAFTGCTKPVQPSPGNNENYISHDVDENGNFIPRETVDLETSKEESSEETSEIETETSESTKNIIIRYIDVGNADCNLIQFPNGENMLIDGGNVPDGNDVCTYLSSIGVERLDYIVGTHPHEDHIGGLVDVINNFDIGTVYMPRIPDKYVPTTKVYQNLLTAIANKNLTVISPNPRDSIFAGDAEVVFMNDISDIDSSNINEYSIVLKVEYGNNRFIFTGDAEAVNEKTILNQFSKNELKCDILKIGHHGSSTSNTKNWLKTLSPKYAYIPCGADNKYGHPHDETVKALNSLNVEYYRADQNGTMIVTSNGNDISIETKMTGDVPLGDKAWNELLIK